VNAFIDSKSANAIPQFSAVQQAVATAEIKVPVEKLDCGNGTMNDHMRNALKTKENPTIAVRVVSYEISKDAGAVNGAVNGARKGSLSMGVVVKPVSIAATGTPEGEMLRVVGSKEIKMTVWDVTPPSLMFGRIEVRDFVTVNFRPATREMKTTAPHAVDSYEDRAWCARTTAASPSLTSVTARSSRTS